VGTSKELMPLINVSVNASLDDKVAHNTVWEMLFNLLKPSGNFTYHQV
jgi:hypothetical protein